MSTTPNIAMLSVIRDVPEDEYIYDRIIQTYIKPLFLSAKLNSVIYDRILKEFETLRKKKKKKTNRNEEVIDVDKFAKQRQPVDVRRPLPPPPVSQTVKQPSDPKQIDKILGLKETISILENKIQSLKEENRNLRDAANDLRKRLSEVAGHKMKTNNPNIVDLSDKYRPTELGKLFAELYDNEWSDAFEEVNGVLKHEIMSVHVLYTTVRHAFRSCHQKAKVQEEKIRNILLDLQDDCDAPPTEKRIENLHNQLIEPRKSTLHLSSVNVAKNYLKGELPQLLGGFDIKKPGQKLTRFAQKCAEFCWCMNMCDPPMDMNAGDIDKPFDKNVYREYTRSTKDLRVPLVEFIVWPALYLNSGGNMVSKGVAQPYDKISKSQK